MASPFPITGIDAGFRVPGGFAEILFAQGAASANGGVRSVVFVMPKLSSGTWTAGTLYPILNENDAQVGAGLGSMIHRAARKYLRINKDTKLFALPFNGTSGGTPVAATSTITIATNATAVGTVTAEVGDEICTYTFLSGATPTTIAAGLAAVINDRGWLPCTAAAVAGVITLTARLTGISQGTSALPGLLVRVSITPGVGTTVTTTGGLGSAASGAEGSTTEATNLTNALVALEAKRNYYMVISATDATSIDALKTHIALKCEPKRGLRSVGIFGYTGGLAAAQTLAIARNYERLQMAWQMGSRHDAVELAAAVAAVRQKGEQLDSAYCFDSYRLDPHIQAAPDVAMWPDADDQNDAINDGITCIASDDSGSYIVMSVNTRSKNPARTQDDFRACETHRVSVADDFVDSLLVIWANDYQSRKIVDDVRLADGSINPNQPLTRGTIRPSDLTGRIRKHMTEFGNAAKLQNVEATKASVVVLKNGSQLAASGELNAIDHAHQLALRVAEISQA